MSYNRLSVVNLIGLGKTIACYNITVTTNERYELKNDRTVPSSIFGQISSIDSLDNLRTLNYLIMVFSHSISKRCQFYSVMNAYFCFH